jgi:HK97 gp10 family phage protein
MDMGFDAKGFREIDDALAALPRVTSKAVARRGLKKALQPVTDLANAYWPGATDDAFAVSNRLQPGQAAPQMGGAPVIMYVGSTKAAPHAHLLEWGTEPRFHKSGKYVGAVAPQPMLTPSWDANKNQVLASLAEELRKELQATMARRAKQGY